jgi:Fe-Mn family superoxide dismutase
MFKIIALILTCLSSPLLSATTQPAKNPVEYQAKDYAHLLGMQGFSDALLKMHFKLYEGYVKNTNLLLNSLRDQALQGKSSSYEWGALKRRLAWEFDGMRLHELYFNNLGGKAQIKESSGLYARILQDFGSYEQWKKDFISTGMIRGIGWAVLYRDPQDGRLLNTWINEHDLGHLSGGIPILVMDVFEHAYITQYGLERAQYIDSFFENIRWQEAERRFDSLTLD